MNKDDKRERMRLHGDVPKPPPAPLVEDQIAKWFRDQHGLGPAPSLVRAIGGLSEAERKAKAVMARVPAEERGSGPALLRAAVKIAALREVVMEQASPAFEAALHREALRLNEEREAVARERAALELAKAELPEILAEAERVFGE